MADRHIDLRSADIGNLHPPSSRRMIDLPDKRERGLVLRLCRNAGSDTRLVVALSGHRRPSAPDHSRSLARDQLRGGGQAVAGSPPSQSAGKDPIEAHSAVHRALDGRMRVADLIERYEAVRSPALKSGGETMRLLKKHVAPAIGGVAVADVTGDHIRRLLAAERERLARDDAGLRKRD